MNDTELREFCNQMIGKFKALSELQTEMQYETIDTKFTEWELKKLIFALDVLRITADRKTEPQTDIHDLTDCDFCKDRNCKDCEGGKDEPQTEREGE